MRNKEVVYSNLIAIIWQIVIAKVFFLCFHAKIKNVKKESRKQRIRIILMYDDRYYFSLEKGVKFYPGSRCIITNTGNTIELSENSYRFLMLLLEGEFDKQKIISEVWREQRGLVSDSSYYGQIYILRKALEAAGLSGGLIKTIPRRGVRYLGKVDKCICESSEVNESLNNNNTNVSEEDVITDGILSDDCDFEKVLSIENNHTSIEWYKTKQWGAFISILAVLAVCWLTTLIFLFFIIIIPQ